MNNSKFTVCKTTTLEQSKRLVNAGLDPMSSDMCYAHPSPFDGYARDVVCLYNEPYCSADVAPAWSLGRLFEIYWQTASVGTGYLIGRDTTGEEIIEDLVTEIEEYLKLDE